MGHKLDINVCYRKVFELIGHSCTMQQLLQEISDYTRISVVVTDIIGNVLGKSVCEKAGEQSLITHLTKEDYFLETVFDCMDSQDEVGNQKIKIYSDEYGTRSVSMISTHGNDLGICFLVSDQNENVDADIFFQLNELVCKALSMITPSVPGKVSGHHNTLRKIVAKMLLENNMETKSQLKEIQEMIESKIKPGFVLFVLQQKTRDFQKLQIIGDELRALHDNMFFYVQGEILYGIFVGVRSAEKIYKIIENVCKKHKSYCGISELFEEQGVFSKKKYMAEQALKIGRRNHPDESCYFAYDYYMQIVCSCAVEKIGEARYMENKLQELKKEDEIKETEFYNTLKMYLLQRNNVSTTARSLFIHRNTMIYRLHKISDFLNVDINDPITSQKLLISMMLQEQEQYRY